MYKRQLEHGAISISATETALNIYLAEKLRAFHTDYPGIRLRISNHLSLIHISMEYLVRTAQTALA